MAKSLDVYRAKRDFDVTPEPSDIDSRPIRPSEHLRFVIQKHDATRLHYDLRLELDGVFKSWAVTRGPSLDPADKRLAVEVEDHPLQYGDFEGTIPEGEYGGGTVMIWDRGFWAPETPISPVQSLRDGELKFILAGSKLQGSWVLVRMKTKPSEKNVNWLLVKHRDKWATPGQDDILNKDRSAASGRQLAAIAAGRGKPSEPFMTVGAAADPAAVWDIKAIDRNRLRALAAAPPATDATMPRLTNPDRVLWPDAGITKRDLAEYLLAVAPWLINHIYGRPCSVLRAPDGIDAESFFQRHAMAGQAELVTVNGDPNTSPICRLITLRPWPRWRRSRPSNFIPGIAPHFSRTAGPVRVRPGSGAGSGVRAVVAAAHELKERLTRLGLVPFCKTTGGKGLHVVTPFQVTEATSWPEAKAFAREICAQMASDSR